MLIGDLGVSVSGCLCIFGPAMDEGLSFIQCQLGLTQASL